MSAVDVLTTVAGGLGGGLLRLAPEVLKLIDRKNERKHEIALGQQQMELVKLQGQTRLDEARLTTEAAQYTAGLESLKAIVTSQLAKTGNAIVDALNALVRPLWTYLVLLTWFTVKVTDATVTLTRGLPWEQVRPYLWGAEDAAMLSMLGTFWFLDRVLKKQQ